MVTDGLRRSSQAPANKNSAELPNIANIVAVAALYIQSGTQRGRPRQPWS